MLVDISVSDRNDHDLRCNVIRRQRISPRRLSDKFPQAEKATARGVLRF